MAKLLDCCMIKKTYFDGKIEGKNYKIVELKDRIGFIILDEENEEIFIDNIFICEISDLIFKIEVLVHNLFTKPKQSIRELYYDEIVKCILLCIKIKNSGNNKELSDEINEFIIKINDVLTNRLLIKNKIYYFCAYLFILCLISLIDFKLNSVLIKTLNMGVLGGFVAINYRLTRDESFVVTYSYIYYSILGIGRAFYSIVAGIVAYYLINSNFANLFNISNINCDQLNSSIYLLAMSLGYSTRYLPSIFSNIVSKIEEKNSSKNQKGAP